MPFVGRSLAALSILVLSLQIQSHAAGAGVWTKPATVKLILPRIYPLGGNSYPSFEFKTNGNPLNSSDGSAQSGGTTCGETTSVILRGIDGASYDLQMKSLQSMQSAIIAALAAGKKIRIKWDGNLCFANEIVLCGDDTCGSF